ncbi:MAG: YdeI/OmpD-associated family protein, partial [Ferruginibacter sp.]
MNPKVDFYFSKSRWPKELEALRKIVLECGLTEELKWGSPCYTYAAGSKPANIVLIHEFKEYCALLFFKGALLQNSSGILIQQTTNVQAARQARFTSVREIVKQKSILKACIYEAIEVEKAGLKVALKKPDEFVVAEEFQQQLKKNAALKK